MSEEAVVSKVCALIK